MNTCDQSKILSNVEISHKIYKMVLETKVAKNSKAGQFVQVYTGRGEFILPRPISISEISEETITIIYQAVGKGTDYLSTCKAGEYLKIIGPLGNGFTLKEEGNHVLVGGGIGVPPLLELAKQLKGNITVFIGARTAPILIEEFEKIATVHVATDDGSVGFKGNIVALMDKINPDVDFIYSCGPNVMLKYLSKWALEKGIDPQVSMEERMACGIGACVGCAIKVKSGNDWEHKKVCKDGPVFLGSEVIWND